MLISSCCRLLFQLNDKTESTGLDTLEVSPMGQDPLEITEIAHLEEKQEEVQKTSHGTAINTPSKTSDASDQSPARSLVVNWSSPEDSSFSGSSKSFIDLGSPTVVQRGADPKDASSSNLDSGNSSYELVEEHVEQPPSHFSSPSDASSPQSNILPMRFVRQDPPGASSTTLRVKAKVVLSLPGSAENTPTKSSRGRALSASNPRTLGQRQTSFGTLLPISTGSETAERRGRRASHDGSRARSSLSPVLSPIDDEVLPLGLDAFLNPSASSFQPKKRVAPLSKFPRGASHDFIIIHGKSETGDLTKEARAALLLINLRPVPSMHGPLSLPYARCPSFVISLQFLVSVSD